MHKNDEKKGTHFFDTQKHSYIEQLLNKLKMASKISGQLIYWHLRYVNY